MSELNSIINVTISRLTSPIGQKGFGTVCILGTNATFSPRAKFYSSTEMATLAAELTGTTGAAEYKMAQAIFSQSPHGLLVMVGKKIQGDTDYEDALDAILLYTSDFYGVVCTSRLVADQKSVAKWVQANERIAVFSSDEANIVDQTLANDSTSIAYEIKHAAYDRSAVVYHSLADTEFLDAAILGWCLSLTPGSYTVAHKTFSGITVDDLNATQSKNAQDKYCSTYEEIADRNVLLFGWVGTGEYIDIIVLADWTKQRIAENNFLVLANNIKMPFTDAGITAHENATRQILQIGMDNGGFTPMAYDRVTGAQTGGFSTTFPKASEVPILDKAARKLTGARFKAWLAGAIHTVAIEGVITLE